MSKNLKKREKRLPIFLLCLTREEKISLIKKACFMLNILNLKSFSSHFFLQQHPASAYCGTHISRIFYGNLDIHVRKKNEEDMKSQNLIRNELKNAKIEFLLKSASICSKHSLVNSVTKCGCQRVYVSYRKIH